jgi:hypothetical protein
VRFWISQKREKNMKQRKKLDECKGKPLTGILSDGSTLILAFGDDSYAVLTLDPGYEAGDATIKDDQKYDVARYHSIEQLIASGIFEAPQAAYLKKSLEEQDRINEEQRKHFRRQQYEQLKKEFEAF